MTYNSTDLDLLAAAGEIVWIGHGALGTGDGRVALYFRDHVPLLYSREPGNDVPAGKLHDIIRNHLLATDVVAALPDLPGAHLLQHRSVITRRLEPLPIEAVVRGYLIGSGWKDYKATGTVCGIELPGGLELADRLLDVRPRCQRVRCDRKRGGHGFLRSG